MSIPYGFTLTKQGLALTAKLLANQTFTITRIMVGTGRAAEDQNIMDLTDLIQPLALATATAPIVEENNLSFTVEYRSDMNGGLDRDVYLNEFGVFARDPDVGEILLYYGSLGEYPEPIRAYKTGDPVIIRRYPVNIMVTRGVDVTVTFLPDAYITAGDMAQFCASMARMIPLEFTIPVTAWAANPGGGRYQYRAEIRDPKIKADQIPEARLDQTSLAAAFACGLCPLVQSENGTIRFLAEQIPKAAISGTCILLASSGGSAVSGNISIEPYLLPAATADTLGGVKIGQGVQVTPDGTISTEGALSPDQVATEGEVSEMLEDVFGPGGSLPDGTGGSYTLPVATRTQAGAVKPGAGLAIAPDGTLSVDTASEEEISEMLTELRG